MDKMDTEDSEGIDLSQNCWFVIQKPLYLWTDTGGQ